MSKVVITESYLSNLASAIRGKAGTASLYTPAQMASAITNLPSGVSVSALSVSVNGTYSAPSGYAYDPVTVDVQGGGGGGNEDAIIERTISGTYYNSNISTVGNYAFYSCSQLTYINMPNVSTVSDFAFASCKSLSGMNLPNVSRIGSRAFQYCGFNGTIQLPEATVCYDYAFANNSKLQSIECEKITTFNTYAFANCSSLLTVYAPSLQTIGSYCFNSCKSLSYVSFPSLQTVYNYAFQNCTNLSFACLPNVGRSLPITTFASCSALLSANFPKIGAIYNNAFANCIALSTASFPKLSILNSAFYRCVKLLSLYLLGSSVAALNSKGAFNSTPISDYTAETGGVHGSIFVRASLYQSWIKKANWSLFSARFVSLTDEQIAALDAQ